MAALTPEQVAQLAYQAGFRGDALTTIVAIAKRESGYNPSAYNGDTSTGDNSVGLTQINLIGDLLPARGKILQQLGYNVDPNNAAQVRKALEDPLTNLKVAFVLSSSGTNFYPWGGYKGQDPTYATDIPAARTAVQNAGLDGGTGQHFTGSYGNSVQVGSDGSGTGSDGSGSGNDNSVVSGQEQLRGVIALWGQVLNDEPQASDPQYSLANDPDGTIFKAAHDAWADKMSTLGDMAKVLQSMYPTPPATDPFTQEINQFNAELQAFEAKRELSNDAQNQSVAEVNRFLGGLAESRARAEDQEKAQEFISQWGAPAGKTSFSRADLGMPLVNGVDQSAPFISYGGQAYINPNAAMAANDRALGVSGQMPPIQGASVFRKDVPTPPTYNESAANAAQASSLGPSTDIGNWWQQPDSEGNVATESPTPPPSWHPPMAPPSPPSAPSGYGWMTPGLGPTITDPNAWWLQAPPLPNAQSAPTIPSGLPSGTTLLANVAAAGPRPPLMGAATLPSAPRQPVMGTTRLV